MAKRKHHLRGRNPDAGPAWRNLVGPVWARPTDLQIREIETVAGISAKDVKALRDSTGAGMMDCKRALSDSEGDVERVVQIDDPR